MSLTVILDQNIPPKVAVFLRSLRPGWCIHHVSSEGLNGVADGVIFGWAQERGAVVITFDEDFADTRMYPVGTHAEVVRLRVWPTTIERTEVALRRLLDAVEEEHFAGSLIVIDDEKIRIRRSARHG